MKAIRTVLGTILTLTFAIGQIGCNPQGNDSHAGHDHPIENAESPVKRAIAELQPTEGNEARGTVTFTKVEEGIYVTVDLQGLGNGPSERGFHIHEHGDCSAPDGTSAGGHFNPADMPHGAPDEDERHAGDFGNLTVDEDGNVRHDFLDTNISFDGPHSIIGRAVIVHAQRDDLETQPTGDAGARVACGVILVAEDQE